MLAIGDRERGTDVGKKGSCIHVWVACPVCGFERWVQETTLVKYQARCAKCAPSRMRGARLSFRGFNNPAWKGGRILLKTGYIRVRLMPEDPMWAMGNHNKGADKSGYVLEHRLVMAQHLGRCLKSWEVVHHINGDRTDNRIENLELLPSRQEHMGLNILQEENKELRERIAKLEARVTVLEAERVLAEVR